MTTPSIDKNHIKPMVQATIDIARIAGTRILEIYEQDFDVHTKKDGSPVTTADHASHDVIVKELSGLTPDVPVMSEESAAVPYAERRQWSRYWLVDPLDGTKEFVHKRGDFTVNIALVQDQEPILGVVYTPVQDLMHWGVVGAGAYRSRKGSAAEQIRVRNNYTGAPVVVASRSHGRGNLEKFLQSVASTYGSYDLAIMGSALKICLVAEGNGDVYPRLGLTSEWDTAAAHCVLLAAGGVITDYHGQPLRYNKESVLNPWFIAAGNRNIDWHQHLKHINPDE